MTTDGLCANCGAPWHTSLACCEYCDLA
jgi:hypothetical protein